MLNFFVPTYGIPGNNLSIEDRNSLEDVVLKGTTRGSKKHMTLMHMLSGESWALADYRVYLAGNDSAKQPNLAAVSESKIGNPAEQFCFDKRFFSRSFLNYLNGLCFLKQNIDTSLIRTVLEIGGGFGSLGEILHQSGDYAYIDVDIPPTAAVASFYLNQVCGNDFIDYRTTRAWSDVPVPALGTSMVLCPWQLPNLKGGIDLFVNFISFQEMEPPIVEHYLQQVDRLNARYILLRNLREGKAKKSEKVVFGVETPITGADYDRFLGNYRLLSTNVMPFGYRTIDGFHSELRLYHRFQ
jgi:putative sugar O-methyltransferase